MRAHEVPTHVQAEDRVLLWLTFPQIVTMTAVCALAYGLYQYAPARSCRARASLAPCSSGSTGFAVVAGRVNGRRLPLVAADLLRYALGARRYAGPPVRARALRAAPAPVQSPGRPRDRPTAAAGAAHAAEDAAHRPEAQGGRAPRRAPALPAAAPLRQAARRRGAGRLTASGPRGPRAAARSAAAREARLLEESLRTASALALVMLSHAAARGSARPGQPGATRAGPPRRSSSSPRPWSPAGGSSWRALTVSRRAGPRSSCGRPRPCASRYASTAAPGAALSRYYADGLAR